MYAAAIWDHRCEDLVPCSRPARDQAALCDEQNGGLAFASEITALRQLPDHRFDVDERGVHDFFSFGHVLGPRSIFSQVRSLEPGHLLRIGPDGEPDTHCFWRARLRVRSELSEQQWVEQTRARVLHTVGQHMLSDVPVGAFLSGGVDSGAVAAAMARSSPAPFKAFTAGFPGSKIDETEAARSIADHLGCEHIVLPIEPKSAAEVLPAVQRAFDEPSAANSAIPHWHLSQNGGRTRQGRALRRRRRRALLGYKRQRTAKAVQRWAPAIRALGGLRFMDASSGPAIEKAQLPSPELQALPRRGHARQRLPALLRCRVRSTSPALRARIYNPDFWLRQDAPNAFAASGG